MEIIKIEEIDASKFAKTEMLKDTETTQSKHLYAMYSYKGDDGDYNF